MITYDLGDESIRRVMAEWVTASNEERVRVAIELQDAINLYERPPIIYDNSEFRPATKHERDVILNKVGHIVRTVCMPDFDKENKAGLFVGVKNNEVHTAFSYSKVPNEKYPLSGFHYDAPVVMFAPIN